VPTDPFTELTQNTQQRTSESDTPMWMSPNGNFVYVGAGPGQIWDYQIDQTTGALTLVQKYNIGPGALAFDPAAPYVLNCRPEPLCPVRVCE